MKGNQLSEGLALDGIKLSNGKVAGKIPVSDFIRIRQESIHNSNSKTMTLGKYRAEGKSYVTEAINNSNSYFDLGDSWTSIQSKYNLTGKEMFDFVNAPALNDAIYSGKTINFSHNPNMYTGSYLADEWSFLQSNHNYTNIINEGNYWYAVK